MAVVAGSSQLHSYSPDPYRSNHILESNAAYEDQVVPALRKRLEEESRALAKRMSVHSILSSDTTTPYISSDVERENKRDNVAPLPAIRKAKLSTSFGRKRTYSTPYPFDAPIEDPQSRSFTASSPASRATSEIPRVSAITPQSSSRSRIPKPTNSRIVSAPQTNTRLSPLIPSKASLLEEEIGPALIDTYSSSQEELTHSPIPSGSNSDTPITPFASTPLQSHLGGTEFEHWYRGEGREGGGRNGGRGEISAGTHEMLKIAMGGHNLHRSSPRPDSILLDDSVRNRRWQQENVEWGDVRNEEPLTDMEVDGEATDAETSGTPRMSVQDIQSIALPRPTSFRSTTPPPISLDSQSAELTTPKAARRKSRTGKSPAVTRTPTQARVRKKTSLPVMHPPGGLRSTYDLSTVPTFADAVPPSDNQPSIPASGNWDEVILPTIAKKMRIANGATPSEDRSPRNPERAVPRSDPIPPAPGTFDYDESKAHPRRRRSDMHQFGVVAMPPSDSEDHVEKRREPGDQPPSQGISYAPQAVAPVYSTSAQSGENRSSKPESHRLSARKPDNVTIVVPQTIDMDDLHESGCCKCVVM